MLSLFTDHIIGILLSISHCWYIRSRYCPAILRCFFLKVFFSAQLILDFHNDRYLFLLIVWYKKMPGRIIADQKKTFKICQILHVFWLSRFFQWHLIQSYLNFFEKPSIWWKKVTKNENQWSLLFLLTRAFKRLLNNCWEFANLCSAICGSAEFFEAILLAIQTSGNYKLSKFKTSSEKLGVSKTISKKSIFYNCKTHTVWEIFFQKLN